MPTKRITYIDALRGFTMLLVVMNHVSAYCFGVPFTFSGNEDSLFTYVPYLREFRMPLFFFISGFVLYKAADIWNGKHIIDFFKKKIPVQLLSPFVFFALYLFINNYSLHDGIFHSFKKGYWFTYTLLEFYIFYSVIRFVLYKVKTGRRLTDLVIFGWAVLIYGLSKYIMVGDKPIFSVLGTETWYYYLFFTFGTLTRKHFTTFEKMLDNGLLVIPAIVLYFGVNIFNQHLPFDALKSIILSTSGIVIVFSFFRKYCNSKTISELPPPPSESSSHHQHSHDSTTDHLSQNIQTSQLPITPAATSTNVRLSEFEQFKAVPLQFVGRRTLDIYLLHFFFIPRQLSDVFPLFRDNAMPVLEMACSFLLACVVVLACLIVGSVLRINPYMANWLFGAKIEKK